MNKRFFIVLWMLTGLWSACKRNKESPVPSTIFEAQYENFGIVKFTPSDSEGTQVWNFGDGTQSDGISGEPIWHYYTANGTYLVKLVVQSDQGGKSECFLSVTISNVPQHGFIKGFRATAVNDTTSDSDSSDCDLFFNVKRYTENATDILYQSSVYTNVTLDQLPLRDTLNEASRIEFPLYGNLISVSMEDDNRNTIFPNDILCYMAWYEGSLIPTKGVSWISEASKPGYYPAVVLRSQMGNSMEVMFEWE